MEFGNDRISSVSRGWRTCRWSKSSTVKEAMDMNKVVKVDNLDVDSRSEMFIEGWDSKKVHWKYVFAKRKTKPLNSSLKCESRCHRRNFTGMLILIGLSLILVRNVLNTYDDNFDEPKTGSHLSKSMFWQEFDHLHCLEIQYLAPAIIV